MPMAVRLTRFASGVDAVGKQFAGVQGTEVTLDDQTANDLVSAGAAVQLEPFAVKEHTTSAPPWSAEKIGPAIDQARQQAELVGQAGQAQQEATQATEAAEQGRLQAHQDAQRDDAGQVPVVAVGPHTRNPLSGVSGAAGVVVQQGGPADRTAASSPARGSGTDPVGEGRQVDEGAESQPHQDVGGESQPSPARAVPDEGAGAHTHGKDDKGSAKDDKARRGGGK